MGTFRKYLALSFFVYNFLACESFYQANSCYKNNQAQKCSPDFNINVAYNKTVIASNTCGVIESEYCLQTNRYGDYKKCDLCDMRRPDKSHPAEYLNDHKKNSESTTWWQSDTMEYDIQYPNHVNLTIHLGKSFEIAYVQVKFISSRPESFAIYKRTNENSEWEPYQYYSASCQRTYNKSINEIVEKSNEAVALCSDEFSDIAPLSGASVVFSTLESRPSAYHFEGNAVLNEWVTATEIRLSLNRLNTFGDDIFNDPKVLRSYFYAISDISIGGKCKCNGHAENCIEYEDHNLDSRLRCECEHNTAGVDCEKCAPFYNDRPWGPGSYNDANECKACDCNGLSNVCEFQADLYEQTGSGGYCLNCTRNTEGQHCEYCKFGFFRRESDNECLDCKCNVEGSKSVQCDPNGRCSCKPGVYGEKCDMCMPNHYDLTVEGCKKCQCDENGSYNDPPVCNPINGQCVCKSHVEGKNCERCKPGFFNLDGNITAGCLPCFCFGHSSQCSSSFNYIGTDLNTLDKAWTATNLDKTETKTLQTESETAIFVHNNDEDIWFNAPNEYLGNQRNSYNQKITFSLEFILKHSSSNRKDMILEGNGMQVYRQFYDQIGYELDQSSLQASIKRNFSFTLKESDGWRPSLSKNDFHRLLSNLTAIKIKTTFGGFNFLRNFKLESAKKLPALAFQKNPDLTPVSWIEQCVCPEQYSGQYCEKCQVGYTRDIPYGDEFSRCVPCSCNNHSISCNPVSGQCDCIHNTIGENCELCKDGYYGNALTGSSIDCKECPCPNRGPCAQIYNYQSETNDVVCLKCPEGTKGNLCDTCEDGYFNFNGTHCEKCDCNGNVDENVIGNCDSVTGKCLRCNQNTDGDHCEDCLPGYWGDALTDLKCHACECNELGSTSNDCDLANGQCSCKKNVVGRRCDECKDTFWNLTSNEGCVDCACDPLGATDLVCNKETGVCNKNPGVTGDKADRCMVNHFNFTKTGCQECQCHPFGSVNSQCDLNGRCKCIKNMAGDKCNKCEENYSNFTLGCIKCDDCYDLVEKQVTDLRYELTNLSDNLNNIDEISADDETKKKNQELAALFKSVKTKVNDLHAQLFSEPLVSSYDESMKQAQMTYDKIKEEFEKLTKTIKHFDEQFGVFDVKKKNLMRLKNKSGLILSSYLSKFYEIDHAISEKREGISLEGPSKDIAELAKKGRLAADEQNQTALKSNELIRKYVEDARGSLNILDDIVYKIATIYKESFSMGHDATITEAEELIDEANELKESLVEEAKTIMDYSEKLSKVDLSDAAEKVLEDTKAYNDTIAKNNEDINELISQSSSLKREVTAQKRDLNSQALIAREALGKVQRSDVNLNQLLERSELANNNTQAAIKSAQDSYTNASNILETYQNFDKVLSENIEKSSDAMRLTDETTISIRECQNELQSSEFTLNNCNRDTQDSSILIKQAERLIIDIMPLTGKLLNNSQSLEAKQSELVNMVNVVVERESKAQENLERISKTSDNFESRLNDLHENFEFLDTGSNILLSDLAEAESIVTNLNTNAVKSMKEVTMGKIKELSDRFDKYLKSQNNYQDIDDDINDLDERNQFNQQTLVIYEREIPLLKKQIKDLEILKSSLVKECNYYRTRKLIRK